ncbi:MAG TPA: glycosyltransferase [Methylocella sp.]|nr:glycosyltransferase [Methylocella sp.]
MKKRRLRICFIAEQFVPPVLDGSGLVYKAWLDTLSQRHDVYAILFTQFPVDTWEAKEYLPRVCRDYVILPGLPNSNLWKTLRAAARCLSGNLFAPRAIEEYGRGFVRRRIAGFLKSKEIDLFVFSKLETVHQFGYEAIARLGQPCFIDIHDDAIENDQLSRRVAANLISDYPLLFRYKPYRRLLLRQRLSRLSIDNARAQEQKMFELFDCILASSTEEWNAYQQRYGETIGCEFLPWPVGVPDFALLPLGPPEFQAGFIGSNSLFNTEGVVYFLTHILPLVLEEIPDFRCLITGTVSEPLSLIGQNWPGVSIEPYIKDVQSFYARIGTSIVPLLSGTGVSLKTLEALAHGKPVVATSKGVRGLQLELCPGAVVADDPVLFARNLMDRARNNTTPKRWEDSTIATEFLDGLDRIYERWDSRLSRD